ncbi:3-oxoacyl-ACP synthase III family protein [Selenomonas bovis]|uniref:3-oxoacyl-ACP synthase III family protein n=1 Tax=Selenomonas bovis TaxID=416586 RepID=UPI00037C0C3C|nr:ketoacyl-ACP synthase III [Selenomonas bovis]
MQLAYRNKRITGVLTVIPKNCKTFDEEMKNYQADKKRSRRLKLVMGYDRHHFVEPGVCASDLAVFGVETLLHEGKLRKEEIDAIVTVTQSPDYFMPTTGAVIHGRLGLDSHVYCVDISQGCTGYLTGLMEAFSLLDQPQTRKVLLINVDVLSHKVSKEDRNSYPLIGDAASVTVVERTEEETRIDGEIRMDGSRHDALMIPAGGFRQPSTPETAVLHEDSEGNRRSLDNLVMKGADVFNFVQTEMPPLLASLFARLGVKKEEIDWFLFHQPNKFMVEKLAQAIDVPLEKMPSNIVTYFGNASGVTIPTNICYNVGEKLLGHTYKVCLAGFGVGLTWGAMVLELGQLDFCEMVEF